MSYKLVWPIVGWATNCYWKVIWYFWYHNLKKICVQINIYPMLSADSRFWLDDNREVYMHILRKV